MEYQKCIRIQEVLFIDGNFPSLRLSSSYACIKLAYHPQTHSLNWIFECAKGGLKKLNWELLRPQGLRIHSESVHDTIPERKKQLLQKTYFTRKKHHQFVPELFVCASIQVENWEGKNQGVVIKGWWRVWKYLKLTNNRVFSHNFLIKKR